MELFEWSWNLGVAPAADVRTMSDGTIVCYHDDDLARVVGNMHDTVSLRHALVAHQAISPAAM